MTEKEIIQKVSESLAVGRTELSRIDFDIVPQAILGLEEIIKHINDPLTIMVMGEFSTGKSTFINAMVGKEVAAVNATPTTAVITKLCYGTDDKILVHFVDGSQKEYENDSFMLLTSKTGTDGEDITHASIEYVERQLPYEILKYVTIIDSPGLNDINEKHSDATKKFVRNADTVFWMFSALQAGSKSEIAAMESLTPRLKPIAIVNKMDEVDEEEDSPEEFLNHFRIQLKDKVQAVVGISAKFALEGKIENDERKAEIGNLKELEQIVKELVLPNRDSFKLNSFLDEIGGWLQDISLQLNEIEQNNKSNQSDYRKYIEIKTGHQHIKVILGQIVETIKDYCVNECQKYNEQAMFLLGVLYRFGIGYLQDDVKSEKYLEEAAIKNHLLACASLFDFYYKKNDIEKASVWLEKCAEQDVIEAEYYTGLHYLDIGLNSDSKNSLEKALYWFNKAAEQDYSEAQFMLGTCYVKGYGVASDLDKATKWYKAAAEQNNVKAQYALAESYFAGQGVPMNKTTAFQWYCKAANQGLPEAQNMVGRCYEDGYGIEADQEKAAYWYEQAAEKGNVSAQYNIACCYMKGNGTAKNTNKAFYWFKKAGENGDSESQNWVGYCYRNGVGVVNDEPSAFQWYSKAANQGNIAGQFNLATCYENGFGVGKDYGEALYWYQKAADQGNENAQYQIGNYCYYGIGVSRDYTNAVAWYNMAAQKGCTEAQYSLANCYEKGTGVERDLSQAFAWYEKAAEKGDAEAQNRVGRYLQEGWGTNKDLVQGFEWLYKAAEQGLIAAQNSIAKCYRTGLGIEKNISKAIEWYNKAALAGSAEASYNIGKIYENGEGVVVNLKQAEEWYRYALSQGMQEAQNSIDRLYLPIPEKVLTEEEIESLLERHFLKYKDDANVFVKAVDLAVEVISSLKFSKTEFYYNKFTDATDDEILRIAETACQEEEGTVVDSFAKSSLFVRASQKSSGYHEKIYFTALKTDKDKNVIIVYVNTIFENILIKTRAPYAAIITIWIKDKVLYIKAYTKTLYDAKMAEDYLQVRVDAYLKRMIALYSKHHTM